ncbi:TPA: hypothetical protein ACGXMW_005836 [Bacillus paranthracis]
MKLLIYLFLRLRKLSRFMYTKEQVELTGFPIFQEYKCTYPDFSLEFDVDWWTVSELKELFDIILTDFEKETRIQAFKTGAGYRGYAAVYSRKEILDMRLVINK